MTTSESNLQEAREQCKKAREDIATFRYRKDAPPANKDILLAAVKANTKDASQQTQKTQEERSAFSQVKTKLGRTRADRVTDILEKKMQVEKLGQESKDARKIRELSAGHFSLPEKARIHPSPLFHTSNATTATASDKAFRPRSTTSTTTEACSSRAEAPSSIRSEPYTSTEPPSTLSLPLSTSANNEKQAEATNNTTPAPTQPTAATHSPTSAFPLPEPVDNETEPASESAPTASLEPSFPANTWSFPEINPVSNPPFPTLEDADDQTQTAEAAFRATSNGSSAPSGADSLPRPTHFFPSTNLESSETEPTPPIEPVADQATAVPAAAESLASNDANTSGPSHDASILHEVINIEIEMAEGGAYIAANQNTSNSPFQAFPSSRLCLLVWDVRVVANR